MRKKPSFHWNRDMTRPLIYKFFTRLGVALLALAAKGEEIDEQKVRYLINLVNTGNEDQVSKIAKDVVCVTAKGKPMAWIMTIAKNLARMRMRKAKRIADAPDDDWGRYLSAKPEVSADERILLRTAMRILSDDEQQILMLHAVSGMKHREIAQLLDMPTATVLSKYSRAIKKLRTAMEAE